MVLRPPGRGNARCPCPHVSARFYRKPYVRADGSRGEHIIELCLVCGGNVNGAGRWVPRSRFARPEALPLLPQPAAVPAQRDLYGEEAQAR